MKKLVIVSADKEIIELARSLNYELLGFFDPKPEVEALGIPYLGNDSDAKAWLQKHRDVRVLLAVDPCKARKQLSAIYCLDRLETLRSTQAVVSPSAEIGEGSLITDGTRIMSKAKIGRACKLNIGAQVHHDCVVGDFSTLAPQSLLLGTVSVGACVYIGAAAVVLPRIRIGDGATIGAGAVVTRDVSPGTMVVGVPAEPIDLSL